MTFQCYQCRRVVDADDAVLWFSPPRGWIYRRAASAEVVCVDCWAVLHEADQA